MIIWSGKGDFVLTFWMVLALIFFIFSKFVEYLPNVSISMMLKIFATNHSRLLISMIFILAGLVDWFYGRYLNDRPAKEGIDPMTGIKKTFRPNHSLFWIKMEYWGLLFSIIGILILVYPR